MRNVGSPAGFGLEIQQRQLHSAARGGRARSVKWRPEEALDPSNLTFKDDGTRSVLPGPAGVCVAIRNPCRTGFDLLWE